MEEVAGEKADNSEQRSVFNNKKLKKVFQKIENLKKVPSHVLPDVELGEGRRFRLVPSFASSNLDSGSRSQKDPENIKRRK